jgi:transcriptional regulator with XRE-family HTH domain
MSKLKTVYGVDIHNIFKPYLLIMDYSENLLYKIVGENIRAKRESRNFSQADLAEKIGMLRTSVTNIERGRQRPPLHILYKICQLLNVEVKEILPNHIEIPKFVEETDIDLLLPKSPKTAAFLKDKLGE